MQSGQHGVGFCTLSTSFRSCNLIHAPAPFTLFRDEWQRSSFNHPPRAVYLRHADMRATVFLISHSMVLGFQDRPSAEGEDFEQMTAASPCVSTSLMKGMEKRIMPPSRPIARCTRACPASLQLRPSCSQQRHHQSGHRSQRQCCASLPPLSPVAARGTP